MSFPAWITQSSDANTSRVVKSAAITISSGGARFLGSFVTAVVLGRLLTPDDFGLVGMVMPIIAFVAMLADGGVSNHTLQAKTLSQQQLSLTFWIGVIISIALFILLGLLSPVVATIYGDDRLQLLTIVVASALVLSIFNTQHNVLVKRCFKHNYFAVAEIVGSLSGMTAGISLALSGAGYWAIAAAPLVRHIAHSLVIWYLTGWVPIIPKVNKDEIKEILSFGGYVIFSNAVVTGCRNLDKVILGVKFGAEEVGYYAMAYNIMMLPFFQVLTPAGGAIVPYFSQIREREEEFKKAILKVVTYLGFIVAPFMAFAATHSEELLILILGEQWRPATPVFSLLAYASITGSMITPLNWAMIASGQPSKLARWSVITVIPMITAFLIGSHWGGSGIAAGYLVFTSINLVVLPIYCSKFLNLNPLLFLATAAKVFAVAALVSVSQHYLSVFLAENYSLAPFLSLVLKLFALIVTLAVIILLFARDVLKEAIKFIGRRKKPK